MTEPSSDDLPESGFLTGGRRKVGKCLPFDGIGSLAFRRARPAFCVPSGSVTPRRNTSKSSPTANGVKLSSSATAPG